MPVRTSLCHVESRLKRREDPLKASVGLRIILPVVVLVIGVGLHFKLESLKQHSAKKEKTDQAIGVHVEKLNKGTQQTTLHGFGKVRSWRQSKIGSEVQGKIILINERLREGAVFQKDEFILKIDDEDIVSELNMTVNDLKLLKISLEKLDADVDLLNDRLELSERKVVLAKREFDRQQKLFNDGGIASRQELDVNEKNLLMLKDELVQIKNRLKRAPLEREEIEVTTRQREAKKEILERRLNKTEIKAPFTGRIKNVTVQLGQIVNSGSSVAMLIDDTRLEIPVAIKLNELRKWTDLIEEKGWYRFQEPLNVKLRWIEEKTFLEGRAFRIQESSFQDGMAQVLVEVPDSPKLKPGLFIEAFIDGKQLENCIRLPAKAVHGENELYLARKKSGRHVLEIVKIEILKREGDVVFARADVQSDDLYLTTNIPVNVSGKPLRILPRGH